MTILECTSRRNSLYILMFDGWPDCRYYFFCLSFFFRFTSIASDQIVDQANGI